MSIRGVLGVLWPPPRQPVAWTRWLPLLAFTGLFSGVAIKGFEGGQMPLHRRLPKRGFNNIFRKNYQVVNLGRLQQAIDDKKIDAGKPIDAAVLVAAGIFKSSKDGVRLLAKGSLKAKLEVTVAGASKAAIAAVEGAGGSVTVTGTGPKQQPAGETA